MKKLLLLVVGLLFFIFVSCDKNLANDEKTAADYVKSVGYKITDQKGEVQKYTLEKSKLYGSTETIPYQQAWGVQSVEADKYFGKEIAVYEFTVKNHPLEKIYKDSKGINVFIMMSEGKVIGGTSFPNEMLYGSCYSLEGKTLEEVTGLSFPQWQESWKKKYGDKFNKIISELSLIPKEYPVDKAVEDGCFVVLHSKVKSKLSILNEFVSDCKKGKQASLKVVQYTKEGDAIITKVVYDGVSYYGVEDDTRDSFGEKQCRDFEFKYLKEFDEKNNKSYYLFDDKDITYEKYFKSLASSQLGDQIPAKFICSYSK